MKSCYGTDRNSLSLCQAGRMHKWLNDDAPELLSGGVQTASLSGYINSSNGTTSLSCCTHNIGVSSATVTITSQPGSNISWTGSGSGSFSTANNGHTLNLSNLGSLTLTASWNENCKNFTQGWVFFNGGYYYSLAPSPSSTTIDINFSHLEEWLTITTPGSSSKDQSYVDSWVIKDQFGIMQKSGTLDFGLSNLKIDVSKFQSGLYHLTLIKANLVNTITFTKI